MKKLTSYNLLSSIHLLGSLFHLCNILLLLFYIPHLKKVFVSATIEFALPLEIILSTSHTLVAWWLPVFPLFYLWIKQCKSMYWSLQQIESIPVHYYKSSLLLVVFRLLIYTGALLMISTFYIYYSNFFFIR